MGDNTLKPEQHDSGRLILLFAVLSIIFVVVLASAPLGPYFAEWRDVQTKYNRLADHAGSPEIPIAIQQIWKPKLGLTDRCVTCHLGMGKSGPVPGDPLFKAHPPIPHDPKEYGCTICHGGQGRATTRAAAHGFVSHWDEQLLDVRHQTAGCGSCHNRFPWIAPRDLEGGLHLVESLDCISCHRIDGRGRGKAPDLSHVGLKGYKPDWHVWHLAERERDTTGLWKSSYGEITPSDLATVEAFLRTRVGAPRVVEAQALAMERGCLGCHKIGGRGGEEGPALDEVGRRPVGDLRFDGVPGERTLMNYMRRHLIDPQGVVPGSMMPPQAHTEEEADLLNSFVLYLRARALPAEFLPKERARRELLGETPPPLSGLQAYQAFCSGCHGPQGEGRNYGPLNTRFPAIGAADFLGIAPDSFLEETIKAGRPGRRMPSLGATGGSLNPVEVSGVVKYLRDLEPAVPAFTEIERATPDRSLGEQTYRTDCAACHGPTGEGTPLGTPLATTDSRSRGKSEATYQALVLGVPGTAMPRYRTYDIRTLASLLDYLRTQPSVPGSRAAWRLGSGKAETGEELFSKICAGCHGARGIGKLGPALANPGFQQTAKPEYIAATIMRGRAGTPMPAFGRDSASYPKLTATDVLDVVAFVRGLGGEKKGN